MKITTIIVICTIFIAVGISLFYLSFFNDKVNITMEGTNSNVTRSLFKILSQEEQCIFENEKRACPIALLELDPSFSHIYYEIGIHADEQKAILIYPHLTAAAYMSTPPPESRPMTCG